MTRRRQQGRRAVVAVLVGRTVAVSVGAAAPTGRDERPVPTNEELRTSVQVFTLAGCGQGLPGRRAEAVAAAVRARRGDLVPAVSGRGEAEPVAPNTTADGKDDPEGRAKNRRVEIRYAG